MTLFLSTLFTSFPGQVECANGQIGFGRRRRDLSRQDQPDPNKIYEVSMATVVKVAEEPFEGQLDNRWIEKGTNTRPPL